MNTNYLLSNINLLDFYVFILGYMNIRQPAHTSTLTTPLKGKIGKSNHFEATDPIFCGKEQKVNKKGKIGKVIILWGG